MRAWRFSGTFPGRIRKLLVFVPWQRELLDGLLGADLIGFHIQSHCNNFLETVDRTAGIAHRLGAFRGQPARTSDQRAAVPHQRGIHGVRRLTLSRANPLIWSVLRCLAQAGRARRPFGHGRGSHGLHQRAFRSVSAASKRSSKNIRSTAGNSRSCKSARPAALHIRRYHDLMRGSAKRSRRGSIARFQTGSGSRSSC